MKCPKCGYTSFAYLETCRKCSQGLAEQRAAFGLYAQRPEPPDLLMAYQSAPIDVDDTASGPPDLPPPAIDLSPVAEIELDLAATEEPSPGAALGAGRVGGAVDPAPTIPLDPAAELEALELEPHTEPADPAGGDTPPTFDLSQARDITFELEPVADRGAGDTDLSNTQTPTAPPEESPVYDLDLEESRQGLTLGPEVHESRADEDIEDIEADDETGAAGEYILEIEDELELEIDEIELEDTDDSREDDDGR